MLIAADYQYPFLPQMMPLWHIIVFMVGTCIGSFLNVCIWRIPRGESIVSPPSRCPKCGHELPWYENIPLFSWLALRGKCSSCSTAITSRYFFVELLTGMLFFILWFKIVFDRQPLTLALVYLPVTALIITTIFIDIKHFIIPNLTTFPLMIVGMVLAVAFPQNWKVFGFFPEVTDYASHFYALGFSIASMAIGYGTMALLAIFGKMIFKRDALGWGDVKYIAAIGACIGLKACFFSLLFGSLFGALFGVIMVMRKKANGKTALPFGPFLAVGTYVWMFYGERLTYLYAKIMETMPQF
ncbi:MAG: prepilin peptidase [Victivallaceae bacterium]|nr:prepilin peptidase [Victivallaceae bacterium]